jgi:hypothetical protein
VGTWASAAVALLRLSASYTTFGRPHGWLSEDNVFCDGPTTQSWRLVAGPPSPVDVGAAEHLPPNPVVDADALKAHAADAFARRAVIDASSTQRLMDLMLNSGAHVPAQDGLLSALRSKVPSELAAAVYAKRLEAHDRAVAIEAWCTAHNELLGLLISPESL